jgi:hypothetical protein
MTARKGAAKANTARRSAGPDPGIAEFIRDLDHPLKREIERVRAIILGASGTISEGIKWNSLSFRTTEWFATVNLRSRDSVQLVFHLGAKVKDNTKGIKVADPAGLIKWLAKDRCLVTIGKGNQIDRHRSALEAIVCEWITHV